MMKKIILSVLGAAFLSLNAVYAQDKKGDEEKNGYNFESIYDIEATSVKNQYKSGTCWSFSGTSFFESEMIKAGKEPVDLSEMFVVRNCYSDKATKYVRMHGHLNFGPGGSFEDDIYSMRNYGLVPEEAYTGLQYGEDKHVHSEMDELLKDYVDGVIKNKNKTLSPVWHNAFDRILDTYLGEYPSTFEYEGKTYTPEEFRDEVTGLDPDDYVIITSFSHHPYYSQFVFEVPDNWVGGSVYNVKLDELTEIMDHALEEGYSVGWASDVSEPGFSFSKGVAIIPDNDVESMDGSERSKWENMTEKQRKEKMYSFDGPVKQKVITPELRQKQFDNYQTTDDHGMHITGMSKDQNGTIYYKVKNSWDVNNIYDGYFYASKSFVQLKTMNILINKNALTKAMRKKLGIK